MRTFSKKQKLAAAVLGAGVIAVAGGGIAYAYWSSTGTGTGSVGTAAGASDLAIAQTSTISDLAPGVTAETISGTITNNAPNNAYVSAVTVAIGTVTGGAGSCDASDYTLSNPVMTVGQDLTKNGGSASFTGATIAFNDKSTLQDGCKGATVNLTYTSN